MPGDPISKEQAANIQLEYLEEPPQTPAGTQAVTDKDELPKHYFRSAYFLGSLAAVCFSSAAAVGGFALIAPILTLVNSDIGPDPNINWVAPVYVICLTVGLTLVGRLSDIFGRRWFFICGTTLGLIGCIVCATAQNVPALIGGEVLVGLAAASGVSYPFVLGELVPMKWRFAANNLAFSFQLPTSCFGPAVAYSFILHTSAGWRWCYYYLIIWLEFVKNFDFKGTILFVGGVVLFLMALSWGGTVYPWRSGHVIATMVVGGLSLIAFAICQIYFPGPEPLVPIHLFKNFGWVASAVVLGICGGVFYAFAIIWPNMFSVLYAKPNDLMEVGYYACIVALGITVGQVFGGLIAEPLGRTKWQTIISFVLGAIFLSTTAACNENTKAAAVSVLFIGSICIGWADCIVTSITTIQIRDQADIGIAAGIVGAIRSCIGAVCQTIYIAVLDNRLAQTIPAQVPPKLLQAGLPASSISLFLQEAANGANADYSGVPGITQAIIKVGVLAYKHASLDAHRTVFFTSMAFMGTGVILCLFVPNVDARMTGEVAATLHESRANKATIPGAQVSEA